jgi:hypothetical protein
MSIYIYLHLLHLHLIFFLILKQLLFETSLSNKKTKPLLGFVPGMGIEPTQPFRVTGF